MYICASGYVPEGWCLLHLEGRGKECVSQKIILCCCLEIKLYQLYLSNIMLPGLCLYFNFFQAICLVIRFLNVQNSFLMAKKEKCFSSYKKMLLSLIPSKSHRLFNFLKFMMHMKLFIILVILEYIIRFRCSVP